MIIARDGASPAHRITRIVLPRSNGGLVGYVIRSAEIDTLIKCCCGLVNRVGLIQRVAIRCAAELYKGWRASAFAAWVVECVVRRGAIGEEGVLCRHGR